MIPILSPTEIQNLLVENHKLKAENTTLEAQLEQARKLTIIAMVEFFKATGDISINRVLGQTSVWSINQNDLVMGVTQDDLDKIEFLFPEGEPMIALSQNGLKDLLIRLVPEPKLTPFPPPKGG